MRGIKSMVNISAISVQLFASRLLAFHGPWSERLVHLTLSGICLLVALCIHFYSVGI